MEKRWIAHFCLAFVQLDYGVYHVLTKFALDSGANQVVICVLRDVTALVILAPLAFFTERKTRAPVDRWLLLQLFVLGLSGIFLNQLLFVLGLNLTSPAYAAAIQPAIPVFTFLLALANGTETLNWRGFDGLAKAGGILLSVCGALVMSSYKGPVVFGSEGLNAGFEHLWLQQNDIKSLRLGMLCLLGNSFFMAVYIAFQAPVLAKYPHGLTVTASSYFFGTILMTSTGFLAVNRSEWMITGTEGIAVLYAGVFASAINYVLLTWSNSVLGPSLVAIYMPLQPFASSTLSCIFLHSPLYLGSILGSLLILAGLYSVTWGKIAALSLNGDGRRKPLLLREP